MSNTDRKTLHRALLGTSLLGGLAIAGQSFAMTALDGGYMQGDQGVAAGQPAAKGMEGACGEGKCGGSMKKAAAKPAASKPAAAKAAEGKCGMTAMDKDGDHRVSRAEFVAMHKNEAAKFDGIDADHDGYISQAEMDAHHADMKKAGDTHAHGTAAGKD